LTGLFFAASEKTHGKQMQRKKLLEAISSVKKLKRGALRCAAQAVR